MNSSSVTRCVSRCSAAFAATFRNAFISIEGFGISRDFCAETANVASVIIASANANFCFIKIILQQKYDQWMQFLHDEMLLSTNPIGRYAGWLRLSVVQMLNFSRSNMTEYKQNRREFLKSTAAGLATVVLFGNSKIMALDDPFPELVEITIPQLQTRMKSGKLTARRLAEMYLERIKQIDAKTRAVIEINPDALAIADQLDTERNRGKERSMLHGIPTPIKDNTDTADKMLTTAGPLALVDAPTPKQDAFVVQRLRKAGAVII